MQCGHRIHCAVAYGSWYSALVLGVPQAVSDCVFDLLIHFEANAFDGANIQSESRSLGGMSESVTYMRLSKDEADAEAVDIIENYFYGAGLGKLLYRGACLC